MEVDIKPIVAKILSIAKNDYHATRLLQDEISRASSVKNWEAIQGEHPKAIEFRNYAETMQTELNKLLDKYNDEKTFENLKNAQNEQTTVQTMVRIL